jgi:hypothetical protein
MTSRARKSGLINENSIRTALVENRGDLFAAACSLDCTVRELDQYIRRSAELQAFAASAEQVKLDPAYSRVSAEQFENKILELSRSYAIDGINEVHKLATMDFGDSAALAKVKLDAALALRGSIGQVSKSGENENALAELNALYHKNAPRIKEIRQTVITLADEREATQPIVELLPDLEEPFHDIC